MRRVALCVALALSPACLAAQVSYPPIVSAVTAPAPDLSGYARTTDVQTLQAAIPPVCSASPAMDTLTGTPGVATPCTPRIDAARPTVIQRKTTTTASDGTFVVTFDAPFPTVPQWSDAKVQGATQPFLCMITTVTETGVSGKCFQLVATTLPVISTSLLGLVISPFATAAAGLSVRVAARL